MAYRPQPLSVRAAVVLLHFSLATAACVVIAQDAVRRGRVITTSGLPVIGAEVRLLETGEVAITGSGGWFAWPGRSMGTWTVLVRAIGFAPRTLRVNVTGSDLAPTKIELKESAQLLDSLSVVAPPAVSIRLVEFERRRTKGMGRYFTRQDVARTGATRVSALLRALPAGVAVRDSLGTPLAVSLRGEKLVTERGRITVASCVLRTAIDGVVQPWGTSVDILDPVEVLAIEVYLGPASMPAEFASGRRDQFCGLLMFWTGRQ
jgi:hypothetical protein